MPLRLPVEQLVDLIERVVESRYGMAEAEVAEIRARYPAAGPTQVSQILIKRTQRRLAAVAAVAGGAAAAPGIGTAVGLAAAGADTAWTVTRLAEMVMGIGVAHGYDARSLEERKAWILATLAVADGATGTVEELAGKLGARGGIKALRTLGPSRLEAFNSTIVAKMAGKFLARDSMLTLGNVLPFGIGAGVGAVGNSMITRSVGRSALRLFSTAPLGRRGSQPWRRAGRGHDDDVIDVEGEELDPSLA